LLGQALSKIIRQTGSALFAHQVSRLTEVSSVLVVEDDDSIGSTVSAMLSAAGHRVTWARDGAGSLAAGRAGTVDLVILDLGLPDVDGVEVCRQLRSMLPTAVIVMLTARTEEMDVVVGLEAGADDYLTKPFRLGELLARVRAHLRRAAAPSSEQGTIRVGPLAVDVAARRAWVGGHELTLRAKEFDLLARLAMAAGTAVTRETLMSEVWDEHWFGSTKTLDVHVAALRRKLSTAAQDRGIEPPQVSTLRGVGYRLERPEPPGARVGPDPR
jgi:DNA-binding response OmpR family regulator